TKHTNVNQRVLIGLSGGVDSAVAAALLQSQGYAVEGIALQLWQAPAAAGSADTATPAAAVANVLDIPCHVIDARSRFYETVVTPFLDAYTQGRTPNPCVCCNPGLKLAVMLEAADRMGVQWIATGHYARVRRDAKGTAHLYRARNYDQDQAYMLYRLTQRHLRRLLLPLGEIASKAEVREIARQRQLPNAARQDSQDLCFMSGGDYRTLVAKLRPQSLQPGPIYDETGQRLGDHRGLARYTVGQRRGLGIAAAERLYVIALRPEDNALIVGPASSLERRRCTLAEMTFPTGAPPAPTFEARGRIRYRAPLIPATIRMEGARRAEATLHQPQRGLAPGQSLVLYQEDEVIGGGIIQATENVTV
ncbi:MAG: tRNA 2-thiouridine(34) synthase MnmA, partial [Anaerolineales bacterium]